MALIDGYVADLSTKLPMLKDLVKNYAGLGSAEAEAWKIKRTAQQGIQSLEESLRMGGDHAKFKMDRLEALVKQQKKAEELINKIHCVFAKGDAMFKKYHKLHRKMKTPGKLEDTKKDDLNSVKGQSFIQPFTGQDGSIVAFICTKCNASLGTQDAVESHLMQKHSEDIEMKPAKN